jgi:hypothetical protein
VTNLWIALGSLAALGTLVVGIWQVRMQRRDATLAEAQREEAETRREEDRKPRLSVRLGGGFDGNERRVTIHAVLANDGGSTARSVVVDALIDGEAVASSAPVDVAPGQTETVDIDVPRQFVIHLSGEGDAHLHRRVLPARGGATADVESVRRVGVSVGDARLRP